MEGPLATSSEAQLLSSLSAQVDALIARIRDDERRFSDLIENVDERYRESASNLIHYASVRNLDLRNLQERLASLGLSSLGRMEAHVMTTLAAVSNVLSRLSKDGSGSGSASITPVSLDENHRRFFQRSEDLFGEPSGDRRVRIMVTLPSEEFDDDFILGLVEAGTDCVRINCAKGDETIWLHAIESIRRAELLTGQSCRVLMDLAGAKPRTGPLQPGPEVLKWKPERDARGHVVAPARVALVGAGSDPDPEITARADATITVDADWLDRIEPGDRLRLQEARSKKRRLRVVERGVGSVLAESEQTAYVMNGTRLYVRRTRQEDSTIIQGIPPVEIPLILRVGDRLILDDDLAPAHPAAGAGDGRSSEPARIGCTAPEVFADVRVGDPVKFDDGKIEAVVESATSTSLLVRITLARENGSKLRGDRGINFPDSEISTRPLSEKDMRDLDFIIRRADLVGLSFAQNEETIEAVQDFLVDRGASNLGIILKIETKLGFKRLPRLLLQAMRSYPVGVMIARGDLAVECGWERTAEVQEEILWMCEAAHVPVVWATQVLEGLARSGIPSRAEITDAAMANRAECVMLNKGPYILSAIRTLNDVLQRMSAHQNKKTPLLRQLHISEFLLEEVTS